ncbi:DUF4169 family protein [Asticcacaulis sp. EMRT-3]|uniref:DUF4169 family protein n=1 Tax=Asticcacaulis sp. EMRT-3 TaxID=3040349 RepID=UPI0024AEE7BB|nr:DUF4169 family protein [Asticcacaulis sp. EMRT-3]MDI7775260.1 DUF4169 family protein [Asticcacaulis sp. EMRT-3]
MAELINLNKARKARDKQRRVEKAAENRILYGMPVHLKKDARENQKNTERRFEAGRIAGADDSKNS